MNVQQLRENGAARSAGLAAAASAIHMGTGLCRDRSRTAALVGIDAFLSAALDGTRPADRAPVIHIARCSAHGLHGERVTCFVCGHATEQVPMVLAPDSGYRLEQTPGGTWTAVRG